MKRAFRWKPGTVALRQVKKLQKSTELLIAKAPFARLVRECAEAHKAGLLWQSAALSAIQEATEAFVVSLLGDANLTALHANRVTALPPTCSWCAASAVSASDFSVKLALPAATATTHDDGCQMDPNDGRPPRRMN